jgi:hypothetical protein
MDTITARKVLRKDKSSHLAEYATIEEKRYGILHTVVTMSYLWNDSAEELEINPNSIDLATFRVGLVG